VLPFVAITCAVLIAFAALAIDVGHMYVVRAQLQNAADAAAMAGASVYFEDIGMTQDQAGITQTATQRAQSYSQENETLRADTLLAAADVSVGRHDFDNRLGPLLSDGRWNAVEVIVRRTAGSLNGPVQLFFANIFGKSETGIIATARAVADDRFGGYRVENPTDLLPFTMHTSLYDEYLGGGPDEYSYEDGEVKNWGDGILEIRIYPWKESGQDGVEGMEGCGNFGTLNVGIGDQGTSGVEEQIANGITAEQLEAEFGVSEIDFEEDGGDVDLLCTGNPGLSVGFKDTLEARIGDVIGFFLHDDLDDNGSNATYHLCAIRFGRIMEIDLTGNPDTRIVRVQPAPYTSGNVIIEDPAPPTDGMVGRIVLVQ
jgi:hypothetical protein